MSEARSRVSFASSKPVTRTRRTKSAERTVPVAPIIIFSIRILQHLPYHCQIASRAHAQSIPLQAPKEHQQLQHYVVAIWPIAAPAYLGGEDPSSGAGDRHLRRDVQQVRYSTWRYLESLARSASTTSLTVAPYLESPPSVQPNVYQMITGSRTSTRENQSASTAASPSSSNAT